VVEPESTVKELRLSLRRLAAADDAERRRLERELHDGAQQRLVAVRVKLGLLRELVPQDGEIARRFDELESGLTDAFLALRELAHDIYPAVLVAEGPGAALRAAADRCEATVSVDADVGRYPVEIESAVYYACAEALRHASRSETDEEVTVFVGEEGDDVVFAVSTGEGGFDGGLEGVEDRIRALGGQTTIDGNAVRGRLPLSGTELV
jgi:signal transduction histidine kinase